MKTLITSFACAAAVSLPAGAQSTQETAASDLPATESRFVSRDGEEIGTARAVGTPSGLLIRLDVRGLPANEWVAFHIHEGGECDPEGNFESAGGHWSVADTTHGYLNDAGPHSGDMPNMYVPANGRLLAEVHNEQAFLKGGAGSVMGRTFVLHGGADDYVSQPSGDAGNPLACAVIE